MPRCQCHFEFYLTQKDLDEHLDQMKDKTIIQYNLRCQKCKREPELLKRSSGRYYCRLCRKRVRRTGDRAQNCEHLTKCIQCKGKIVVFRSRGIKAVPLL